MKNTYVATFPHQKVLLTKSFRCTWTPFGSFYTTPHTTGLCLLSRCYLVASYLLDIPPALPSLPY